MNPRLQIHIGRLAVPALFTALASLFAPAALAALTDIANSPLSSSSNLAVKPNLMFILDASGSMNFDALPDNTEPQQGLSERKYWDQVFNCKKRIGTSGQPANHCDRVDPPFGAVEFNGLYYNPQQVYRRAIKADGTYLLSAETTDNVRCDPFGGKKCSDYYYLDGFDDYYKDGEDTDADLGAGTQTYGNSLIKEWYGSGDKFNVKQKFPEIVYCLNGSGTGDVSNTAKCRRNGIATTTDPTSTGNPFRYTSAGWRKGYPDAMAVHEFWRPASGTTVTVTASAPLGITCGTYPCATPSTITPGGSYQALSAPFKIVPRSGTGTTGSGFDVCAGGQCTTTVNIASMQAANQFTYAITGRTGQRLASGQFDLIVAFKNGTGACASGAGNRCTVYVTAPNHGLSAGDQIKVYLTSAANTHIIASNGTTVTVLATPAPAANTFAYSNPSATSNTQTATGFYQRTSLFNVPVLRQGNPIYYTIEPIEHCSDDAFTLCTAATAPTGGYVNPAPVRFCLSEFDANRMDTPSGLERTNTKARCQKKYNLAGGYQYPRYGQFRRGELASSTLTYTGRPFRTDCALKPTCTYTEELTNFANWFAYYRNRILMMKTTTGLAFAPIDSRYRVGYITIDPGDPVDSSKYLKIDDFTATQKNSWYTKLYATPADTGTPLPRALARVGRHFAGKTDGINSGMAGDPVQYSCQQNFALLTTDGFWSGREGKTISDSSTSGTDSIGNKDNVFSCSSTDPHSVCRGVWDGGSPLNPNSSDSQWSSAGTLADVAQYYYNTDLRTTGAMAADNVPTGDKDKANWQHMTTFGLGMAEGLMNWTKDYASASSGDYYKLKTGLSGCTWDPACNWPMPGSRQQANLDDLWHASVNGRGSFFYARDTQAVADGLQNALTNLNERNASGSAAATSTPNITPSDRAIFKSSYTTVQWNGEIIAQEIDSNTGAVTSGVLWSARDKVQALTAPASDTRTLYTLNTATGLLKTFTYVNLTATEKTWFDNKCSPLSNMTQCALLDPVTELPIANSGLNMVNFLRGQTQYEATIFRDRQFALGDAVNATPLFIGKPRNQFVDAVSPTYAQWAATSVIANRTPTLYVGANDGMLHAFNTNTGNELWAYLPRFLLPNLWKLAEENYATKHVYYVDGSPTSMDVFDGTTWRTILVGGLNSGGRGYYALDVTNPLSPKVLWEFCNDSTLCATTSTTFWDADLGLSYGNPIITKRASDGKWVVLLTSGYNNVSPGDGEGYLYVVDVINGGVLKKVGTGAGSTSCGTPAAPCPSGLAKLNGWADTFLTDNTTKAAYGGDLLGNIWEFDLRDPLVGVKNVAQALDGSGKPQAITTRPELGLIDNIHSVLFVGTGKYIGTRDLTDPATQTPVGTEAWQQSIYAFKISPDSDTDAVNGNLRSTANGLVKQTITALSADTRSVSGSDVDWGAKNGWYVDLNPGGASPGERVNIDPQLALGTLIIATNVPGGDACSVGGDGWLYQFDYTTGLYVKNSPSGVVARKQQGALIVGVVIYQLQSGSIVGQVQRSETVMRQEDIYTSSSNDKAKRTGWREISPHR